MLNFPFVVSRMFLFFIILNKIGIGIISDVLLFLPSIFLVMFFRRIRRRRSLFQISPILQTLSQLRSIEISTAYNRTKKKKAKLLPWWCLFIAYGLSFIMIIVFMLLIIARGIELGNVKTQKWLGSLIIAFFSSVLFTQPIKVCALSIGIFQDFSIYIC